MWDEFKQAGLLPQGVTFSDHVLGQGVPSQTFTTWFMGQPEFQSTSLCTSAPPATESRDVTKRAFRGTPRDEKFSPRVSGAKQRRTDAQAQSSPESLADRQVAIAGREATIERINLCHCTRRDRTG